MFATSYGWNIPDVLNLTFEEVFKLQDSMKRRFQRMGQNADTDGNINWTRAQPAKKLHDALEDDMLRNYIVEE